MHYRVILVHEKSKCCSGGSISKEIEDTCNKYANSGYVLVTAYRQTASTAQGCNSQAEVGAVLIFARRQ
jgi:hypothetical protein